MTREKLEAVAQSTVEEGGARGKTWTTKSLDFQGVTMEPNKPMRVYGKRGERNPSNQE